MTPPDKLPSKFDEFDVIKAKVDTAKADTQKENEDKLKEIDNEKDWIKKEKERVKTARKTNLYDKIKNDPDLKVSLIKLGNTILQHKGESAYTEFENYCKRIGTAVPKDFKNANKFTLAAILQAGSIQCCDELPTLKYSTKKGTERGVDADPREKTMTALVEIYNSRPGVLGKDDFKGGIPNDKFINSMIASIEATPAITVTTPTGATNTEVKKDEKKEEKKDDKKTNVTPAATPSDKKEVKKPVATKEVKKPVATKEVKKPAPTKEVKKPVTTKEVKKPVTTKEVKKAPVKKELKKEVDSDGRTVITMDNINQLPKGYKRNPLENKIYDITINGGLYRFYSNGRAYITGDEHGIDSKDAVKDAIDNTQNGKACIDAVVNGFDGKVLMNKASSRAREVFGGYTTIVGNITYVRGKVNFTLMGKRREGEQYASNIDFSLKVADVRKNDPTRGKENLYKAIVPQIESFVRTHRSKENEATFSTTVNKLRTNFATHFNSTEMKKYLDKTASDVGLYNSNPNVSIQINYQTIGTVEKSVFFKDGKLDQNAFNSKADEILKEYVKKDQQKVAEKETKEKTEQNYREAKTAIEGYGWRKSDLFSDIPDDNMYYTAFFKDGKIITLKETKSTDPKVGVFKLYVGDEKQEEKITIDLNEVTNNGTTSLSLTAMNRILRAQVQKIIETRNQ